MRSASHRAAFRLIRRRAVSATLLVVYAIVAVGVPLPVGNATQTSGEAYPCANHACGCRSAEQCWRSCCCYTLAERMDWAREHHVRPPEFAIAEAMRSGLNVAWLVGKPAPGSAGGSNPCGAEICVLSGKPPAQPGAAGRVGVCHACCHCCAERHAEQSHTKVASRVIAWRAMECQGKSSNWFAAVPSLIRSSDGLSNPYSLTHWLGPVVSEQADRVADPPAIPPPETV